MRIGAVTTAVLLGLMAVAATSPAGAEQAAVDQAVRPPFVRSVLTADTSQLLFATGSGGSLMMTGVASRPSPDWNRREVFWRRGTAPSTDQTSCATWVGESGDMLQEGLALRVREGRSGRVRAVTLTKNTEFGVHWYFNVLTWDTARNQDLWRTVGQFDMAAAVLDRDGAQLPFPWRVCLRAVGPRVSFKVWLPERMSKPSWTDRTYARSAKLPRGFLAAGRPGWYVGHVPAGGSLVYRGLTAR